MTSPDIHRGVSMADSLEYRAVCQEQVWNAMDCLAAASVALAAINNHIQRISGEAPDVA